MRFLRNLWHRWPPGVCIALLGLLAAIFPIFATATMTPWEKAMWSGGFFALMLLEVIIIFKERARQNRAYALDLKRQDEAHVEQMKRIEEMRALADARTASILRLAGSINDPIEGLKKRALQLSDSILELVYSRMQAAPAKPTPLEVFTSATSTPFGQLPPDLYGKSLQYEIETAAFYNSRFDERVAAILREFAAQGLVDEWLNGLCAAPKTDWSIRMIGERIGSLAEMLAPTSQG